MGSKDREELTEFKSIELFCGHQPKNVLGAKIHAKIGFFGEFWPFLYGFLLLALFWVDGRKKAQWIRIL